MKKILTYVCCLLVLLAPCARAQESELTIVTSFYPMYVFTLNVVGEVPGVTVTNMAAPDTGCLHDYQLLPADMRTLEGADVMIINGAGMESFMDKVLAQHSSLNVLVASEGIAMIDNVHDHDEEAHDHGHDHEQAHTHGVNAHVWLDPQRAAQQVENIVSGLSQIDPKNAAAYKANGEAYAARLRTLGDTMHTALATVTHREIITFHEAFPYFADAFGLEVVGVVEHEPGESPGTRELAQTCDLVREKGIKALFAEPQYPNRAAETIARETGAKVYLLDPVVTGEPEKDAYEKAMQKNLETLLEALQ